MERRVTLSTINMMKRKNSAFTLIELMIVVAIVGILSAVAYPSYQSHVLKSQRQVAQAALVSLSSSMERYYSENNKYTGAALPAIHPNILPSDGSKVTHNLTISTLTANTYTVKATSKKDSTKFMTLKSTGEKSNW